MPLLELGGGLEVLQSRSLSYGVQPRFASFIADHESSSALGVRASWRWGFF